MDQSTATAEPRAAHFAVGVGPLFVVMLGHFLHVPLENAVSFAVGYYWTALLFHPKLEERVSTKQYRFSFIRMAFVADRGLLKLAKGRKWGYFVLRPLPPVGFCALLFGLSGRGDILLAILGVGVYSILDFTERQFSLAKFLKKFEKK